MPTIPQLPVNNTPVPQVQFVFWNPYLSQTQQTTLSGLLGTGLSTISGLASGTAGTLKTDGVTWLVVPPTTRQVLTYAASVVLDGSKGHVFDVTLLGPVAFTTANLADGETYELIVAQDGAGNHAITWPTGTKWPGGTPPTPSVAANAVDVATFLNRAGVLLGISYKNGLA